MCFSITKVDGVVEIVGIFVQVRILATPQKNKLKLKKHENINH